MRERRELSSVVALLPSRHLIPFAATNRSKPSFQEHSLEIAKMEGAGAGVAGATSSTCISRVPAFFPSFNSKPSFFLTEHLHWPSSISQVVHSQLLKSGSTVSDGSRKNRPHKANYAMDDTSSQSQEDETERRMPRGSSSGRWSNQKRLLALFKQIETSISQEKARSTNQSDFKSTKADNASFDSVIEALQQSGRPGKGQTLKKEGDRISNRKNKASETDKEPSSADAQPSSLKVTRPPSNFIKKSPIPSPSTPKISSTVLNAVVESHEEGPLELEKMKLTKLKKIAKARGIKGYSKMKKIELVDLLSSQAKS